MPLVPLQLLIAKRGSTQRVSQVEDEVQTAKPTGNSIIKMVFIANDQ